MNTNNNNSFKRTHSSEDSKSSQSRRQFRNENEKRRRDLFSHLITNLEDILNIDRDSSSDEQKKEPSSPANKLDKASVLRETASFLRANQHRLITDMGLSTSNSRSTTGQSCDSIDFSWKPPSQIVTNDEWLQTAIESMNCFFLVTKADPYSGQIVFVSRNISSLLDYSQNEILNRSLFEFIQSNDHDQLRDYFLRDHKILHTCNVAWRRGTRDDYEPCTIIGAFRQSKHEKYDNNQKYLMSIVKLNTSDNTLINYHQNATVRFVTRINLQGKFIYVDPKVQEFLGYHPNELMGQTHFDFVHPDDLPVIIRAHKIWRNDGNGTSEPYRFLTKGQQWALLQTCGEVQSNSWTGKPESYICTMNSVDNQDNILPRPSLHQSSAFVTNSPSKPSTIEPTIVPKYHRIQIQPPLITGDQTQSNVQKRNTPSDSQIIMFLSNLPNENYRKSIRHRLNQRLVHKRAEIRIREEEIQIIEDIIQFINQFELKNATLPSTDDSILPCHQATQQNTPRQHGRAETNILSTLMRSKSSDSIKDDSFHRSTSTNSSQNTSTDSPHIRAFNDDLLLDSIASSLFCSPHETSDISSPIMSNDFLLDSLPLNVLQLSSSPSIESISDLFSLSIESPKRIATF